jgi:hypothetical protein
MLISNSLKFTYMIMLVYNFINGGFAGFLSTANVLLFVLIEDYNPSLRFWVFSYYIAFFNLIMKINLYGLKYYVDLFGVASGKFPDNANYLI